MGKIIYQVNGREISVDPKKVFRMCSGDKESIKRYLMGEHRINGSDLKDLTKYVLRKGKIKIQL